MPKREFKDITIVIAGNEQWPLQFTRCQSVVGTLPTGDYAVKDLESYVCIERKSIADLVSCCCSKERERFERELMRMKAYQWRWLVIEGPLDRIYAGDYRSKGEPESVVGSVCAFAVRYGVSPIFAGTREHAAKIVEHLCLMCVRRLDEVAMALGYVREKEKKNAKE